MPSHRFERFAILPLIVFEKELPVLSDKGFDNGELVHFKLLIFRGMGIIESPLSERDVSADEVNQPAVLLVEVLNKL